jgi:hypothetical protein
MCVYDGKMLVRGGWMLICGGEMRDGGGEMLIYSGKMCRGRGAGLSQGQMPPCGGEDAALWWRVRGWRRLSLRDYILFGAPLHFSP